MTDRDTPSASGSGCCRTHLARRQTLRGAAVLGLGAPLLAGCGEDAAEPGTAPSSAQDPTSSAPSSPSGSGGGGAQGIVSTSDVPEGSGVILREEGIVVTQPAPGEFKAFTAVCTHQGCVVADVTETINCGCHGSQFSIEDGSPVTGPATAPLAEESITVKGDAITRG